METKVGILNRLTAIAVMLFALTAFVFADGETAEVFLTGTSNSFAGDFVVQTTNEVFHFQGKEYEVYRVYYDNPEMNMKIAVNTEGPCRSYVAYNGEFMFFYNCNKNGFGVRKVMFSNPWVKDGFNAMQFHSQSVLMKDRKVDTKRAVGLVAIYLPQMKG
jgi:hypothetical protein